MRRVFKGFPEYVAKLAKSFDRKHMVAIRESKAGLEHCCESDNIALFLMNYMNSRKGRFEYESQMAEKLPSRSTQNSEELLEIVGIPFNHYYHVVEELPVDAVIYDRTNTTLYFLIQFSENSDKHWAMIEEYFGVGSDADAWGFTAWPMFWWSHKGYFGLRDLRTIRETKAA